MIRGQQMNMKPSGVEIVKEDAEIIPVGDLDPGEDIDQDHTGVMIETEGQKDQIYLEASYKRKGTLPRTAVQ